MEKHRRGQYELYGKCLTFKELARLAGVSSGVMRYRLGKCASIEETLHYVPPTKCSVKGCAEKHHIVRGLCRKHYREQYDANKRKRREEVVRLRLTANEKKIRTQAAEKAGRNPSDWLRSIANREVKQD